MAGMCNAWIAGEHVMIDESMILYCVCVVASVQYMPLNPIKHRMKVFAVCCAINDVLLGFEVYVGAEDETESTAIVIVKRMMEGAGLMEL